LENGHEKSMSIFENPKRELKNLKKVKYLHVSNATKVFTPLKPSLHMKGAHYMPYMTFSEF